MCATALQDLQFGANVEQQLEQARIERIPAIINFGSIYGLQETTFVLIVPQATPAEDAAYWASEFFDRATDINHHLHSQGDTIRDSFVVMAASAAVHDFALEYCIYLIKERPGRNVFLEVRARPGYAVRVNADDTIEDVMQACAEVLRTR